MMKDVVYIRLLVELNGTRIENNRARPLEDYQIAIGPSALWAHEVDELRDALKAHLLLLVGERSAWNADSVAESGTHSAK